MRQLKWAARHRPRALTTLLLVGLLLTAAVMIQASREVNGIRGEFCDWATTHYQAAASGQAGRVPAADLQADARLVHRLGCNR